jgi:hypothetical protein
MGYKLLLIVAALLQVPAPQNPSPMTDTTRPHPRVAQYGPTGQRLTLGQGSLFLRENIKPAARIPLIVHFHGSPWLIEHQVAQLKDDALVITFQLGAGSGVYAKPFADPNAFAEMLADANSSVSQIFERQVTFDPIVLTSWSAGYGAIRAILRHGEHYPRVASVVLLDSMHASYEGLVAAGPRTEDLPVAAADVDAFAKFAADAVAGRKQFVILHSEVFPGTYASTTETADAILAGAGLKRRPVLKEGPIGMQQLSETTAGKLAVVGYAGNTAPDHTDHLYALGAVLERWRVTRR